MRYYQFPGGGTGSETESTLVARKDQKAYDLTTVKPGLDTFGDLATVATTMEIAVDDVADRLTEDAPLIDVESLSSEARRPVVADEVWAAGVTYDVSSDAREEESDRGEIYQDVFENERPEIFFKATPDRTVGPGDRVGIRTDSSWDVPEPELAVVVYRGEIVGYTVGNDMSSRDLEGNNPLYLPQAKIYDRCCAIGPCVASTETVGDPHDLELSMTIERDGDIAFEGSTSTSLMVRTCEELVSYLTRRNTVPELSVLLTGTSLVPPGDFTLREGDRIAIVIETIGTLENEVKQV